MNKLTYDIAGWLNVDLDTASRVQSEMAIYWGADFSEDSNATLKRIAKMAYAEMVRTAGAKS